MVGGAVAPPSASLPCACLSPRGEACQAGQAARAGAGAVASLSLLFASTRRINP